MIKRLKIGLKTPVIEYARFGVTPGEAKKIATPEQVTLYCKRPYDYKNLPSLKAGDSVKTGQKVALFDNNNDDVIVASATGTVASVEPFVSDFGKSYIAVKIDTADSDDIENLFEIEDQVEETDPVEEGETEKEQDEEIQEEKAQPPALGDVLSILKYVPGALECDTLSNPGKPIKTIVVSGADTDLIVKSQKFAVQSQGNNLKKGLRILKDISGAEKVILALPNDLVQGFGSVGVEVKGINNQFPSALPALIMKDILDTPLPEEKSCEDMGITFLNAEAVAALGSAYNTNIMPVEKTVTVIMKDGRDVLVSARIGTPVKEIFRELDITLNDGDRIIFGGPMMGTAFYSVEQPIQQNTDAIMVQDNENVQLVSDTPCINCGECIGVCPAKIPVNMLVRFLEAGQYQDAADLYDLYSCVECGLCSFVCVSRIPIFQYIKLAKYELARINEAEATNDD
ncbi:MAG: 4Fe-4S dicluster domain-containing protein [Desulfobacterales bacterium]|nr:4Fe-4S dicluster domain-containing protein [Desulfobacterales bacterium]